MLHVNFLTFLVHRLHFSAIFTTYKTYKLTNVALYLSLISETVRVFEIRTIAVKMVHSCYIDKNLHRVNGLFQETPYTVLTKPG